VETSWSVTQWKLDFLLTFMFIFSTRLVVIPVISEAPSVTMCKSLLDESSYFILVNYLSTENANSNRLCIGICSKRSSDTTKFQLQLWIKTASWAGSVTSVLFVYCYWVGLKNFHTVLEVNSPLPPKLYAILVYSLIVLLKHVFEFLCFPMTCFQLF